MVPPVHSLILNSVIDFVKRYRLPIPGEVPAYASLSRVAHGVPQLGIRGQILHGTGKISDNLVRRICGDSNSSCVIHLDRGSTYVQTNHGFSSGHSLETNCREEIVEARMDQDMALAELVECSRSRELSENLDSITDAKSCCETLKKRPLRAVSDNDVT